MGKNVDLYNCLHKNEHNVHINIWLNFLKFVKLRITIKHVILKYKNHFSSLGILKMPINNNY